jgi:hypothetical protein
MFKFITSLFRKPTALQIAVNDLEEAKRDYLKAIAAAEFYAAQAQYHDGLILRLTNYLREAE